MMREAGVLVLLLCLSIVVTGFPNNANLSACPTLNPSGHGNRSQDFPSPFTVTAKSSTYTPGQQIQVSLKGICGRKFKGFLLEARSADPAVADAATVGIGTFANQDDKSKPWCDGPDGFGITHTSRSEKESVEVTWTAPNATAGHIVFVVTFVESFTVYWVKQRSAIVRDASLSDTPSFPNVPSAVKSSVCPVEAALTKPTGCGSTMGCFHDCNSEGKACNSIVTWEGHSDHVMFSIKGNFQQLTSGYMAIGLSDDTQMGSDGVTECVLQNGAISVYNSQNTGRANTRMSTTSATEPSGSYSDGIFECSFGLPLTSANNLLDVQKDSYLLLARGRSVSSNGIDKHSQSPMVSDKKADFQKNEDLTGSSKTDVLVKVHASLMVIAWIFAASIGIVVARYFKPQWPDSKWCGEKVWFQMHRSFMMLVLLAAIVAFIIIFVDVQGYSDLGQEAAKKAHPILGIIVTALAIINPIMAIFRPHPTDANRPIFNWAHFGVGSAAHILAVVTVFLGVNLGRPAIPGYVTWILVGYVAWQILIEFLLVFVRCKTEAKDRSETYELSQKGLTASRTQESPSPQSSPVRHGLLFLHFIAITALSTAVIVCIVIS